MKKRYILMTIEKSNYDSFERHFYRLFNSYKELQYHLIKFSNTPNYVIFEESKIRKDKSFLLKNNGGGDFF